MHSHLQRIHNSLQAMDIEEPDNVVLPPPMVCQQNGDFSVEDLAWVDSCLNKDSDILESDWTPLRDVLFKIMSSQSKQDKGKKNITSEHIQESSTSNETSRDEILEDELAGTAAFQGDPFLPTYNEDLKPTYEIEHASENIFKFWDEMEEASDNIFKVWDLEIPVEEGELIKQFHKSLSDNSWKRKLPSALDDSEKGKDLNEGPLDNLVTGITELSLDKKN